MSRILRWLKDRMGRQKPNVLNQCRNCGGLFWFEANHSPSGKSLDVVGDEDFCSEECRQSFLAWNPRVRRRS